jgi:rfaE bifunctional protein kinase chain/domain
VVNVEDNREDQGAVSDGRFKVLVVGDIMLDVYSYVTTERQAPEAKIPVWDVLTTEFRLGGASNVAHNVKTLMGDDVEVYLAGIVGTATSVRDAIPKIRSRDINVDLCIGGATMIKHRYVDVVSGKYLFRCDNIPSFPAQDVEFFMSMSRGYLLDSEFHAVIISDYNKGTVTEELAERLRSHPLVVVDSKRPDLRMFDGCTVLKVNGEEHAAASARSHDEYRCPESFFRYCVVTHGARGATLRQYDAVKSGVGRYTVHSEHFPVDPVEGPTDVTGCGDTHTAALTVSLLRDGDVRSAVRYANRCAREAVRMFGTSAVRDPLKEE